ACGDTARSFRANRHLQAGRVRELSKTSIGRAGIAQCGGADWGQRVRRAELLKKIEASKGRISRTQARINARKAAGQDARYDEKWLAVELDFQSILEGRLKELKE